VRAEQLKGHLDLLLLAAVEREPLHGYAIVEAIRDASEGAFDLGEGTVYPALYRLERGGQITSKWNRVDGRRRRVYRLTPRGRRELKAKRNEWATVVRAMRAVLA
jgi:transcriptional regulator